MLFVLHISWYVLHEIKCGSVCSTSTYMLHSCELQCKTQYMYLLCGLKHGGGESVAVAAGLKAKKSCKVLQLDCK